MPILDELEARGLIHDITDREELAKLLENESVSFYVGYDPTGSSLHIGSLVPTTIVARLQRAGHKPYILVGGATGMIGDPSGKSDERQLLDEETIAKNVAITRKQLEPFVSFEGDNAAVVVNNADWFKPIGFLDFLRDVGKHLTLNYMIAKDSVKSRLEDREQGISYTEFSYMLLQSYDFVHLARTHGVRLQAGGSDQWGNITAGTELARKMGHDKKLFGLVAPLLLDSAGNKMGKTAAGTRMWLDPERTSPYAFYQYWLNTPDADVERMLKTFSWRSLDDIAAIVSEHNEAPHRRVGQRALAEDVTTWVHGEEGCARAVAASQVMFGGSLDSLTDADLEPLLADLPSSDVGADELAAGIDLIELLASTELCKSKGDARRKLKQGGVYVNNVKVTEEMSLTSENLGTETMLILRTGRKSYHVVRVRASN